MLSLSILHPFPTSFGSAVVFTSQDLGSNKSTLSCCHVPELYLTFPSSETIGLLWIIPPLNALLTYFTMLKLPAAFLPTQFYEVLPQFLNIMTVFDHLKKKNSSIRLEILLFRLFFTSLKKILMKTCPSTIPTGNPCDSSPT